MPKRSYCVTYRTGGYANFQWRRTIPTDYATACQQRDDIERMGYLAYVKDYTESMRIGLPETFGPNDPIPNN